MKKCRSPNIQGWKTVHCTPQRGTLQKMKGTGITELNQNRLPYTYFHYMWYRFVFEILFEQDGSRVSDVSRVPTKLTSVCV